MMFAVPLVSANAVAGAMGEFPHLAGTAAALNGMLSFALGAIGSAVVAYLYNDTALPMGAGICGFGILSLLVYVFVLRGAPPPAKS
jgi:DHA1 family bicyclomycin/chloramphenicol resistance-like MFS transporter